MRILRLDYYLLYLILYYGSQPLRALSEKMEKTSGKFYWRYKKQKSNIDNSRSIINNKKV